MFSDDKTGKDATRPQCLVVFPAASRVRLARFRNPDAVLVYRSSVSCLCFAAVLLLLLKAVLLFLASMAVNESCH